MKSKTKRIVATGALVAASSAAGVAAVNSAENASESNKDPFVASNVYETQHSIEVGGQTAVKVGREAVEIPFFVKSGDQNVPDKFVVSAQRVGKKVVLHFLKGEPGHAVPTVFNQRGEYFSSDDPKDLAAAEKAGFQAFNVELDPNEMIQITGVGPIPDNVMELITTKTSSGNTTNLTFSADHAPLIHQN